MTNQERDTNVLFDMLALPDTRHEDWVYTPHLNEVAGLFDIQVVTDVTESEKGLQAGVALGLLTTEDGDVAWMMTPYFATLQELDRFCKKHIVRFRIGAEAFNLGMSCAPDATEWNTR